MRWRYYIPHAWDPPESRTTWADVLLLPDDPAYEGRALWITVDAVPDPVDPRERGDVRRWRKQLAKLGRASFFMETDTMDLTVRAADFDRTECLDWIARWLRGTGLPFSGFVAGPVEAFAGRSDLGAVVVALQQKYGGS